MVQVRGAGGRRRRGPAGFRRPDVGQVVAEVQVQKAEVVLDDRATPSRVPLSRRDIGRSSLGDGVELWGVGWEGAGVRSVVEEGPLKSGLVGVEGQVHEPPQPAVLSGA